MGIRFAFASRSFANKEISETLESEEYVGLTPAEQQAFESVVYDKGEPYRMGFLGIEMLRRLRRGQPDVDDSILLSKIKRDYVMGNHVEAQKEESEEELSSLFSITGVGIAFGGATAGFAIDFLDNLSPGQSALQRVAASLFKKPFGSILIGATVGASASLVLFLKMRDKHLEKDLHRTLGPSTRMTGTPSIWAFGHPNVRVFD